MTKKKGILGKLFGGSSGGCSCGMEIKEETPQKKGCCNMRIVEETEPEQCCCCGTEDSVDKEDESR